MKRNETEILKVDHLCKGNILKSISFTVAKGEMTAIMGPSGSGKSTLLYNVSGMDEADSGEVRLEETEVTRLTEDEKAKLRLNSMGFVFQQMNVLSNLNIIDNILLPALQKRKQNREKGKKEADMAYAKKLMEKMSILELAERKVTEVSGGELQRACICRSMINRPEILFADEPTGALNQSAAAEVMQTFVKLNEEETTVLMVTHDSKVASRCTRILYLLDGEIAGELELGKFKAGAEKEREEKVASWLAQLDW